METIYQSKSGKIINADNIEWMQSVEDNSIDSCVSDFPYAIDFMGKNWDSSKHFYEWCEERAEELIRIMKHGSYAAIFGSPKTNHRMKSAFEDSGFIIVEEIDWLYCSGMPSNQDIGKMYDRKNGVISSEFSEKWNDWKTAGLKPALETITIFQKPLEGTYIENIEKYGVGGMNIGACRVPISKEDIDMINAKASKNPTTTYSDKEDKVYGAYAQDIAVPANEAGRFPPNIVLVDNITDEVDKQTGISKSTGGSGKASTTGRARHIYGAFNQETNDNYKNDSLGGYGDSGGGSRLFPVFKYCPKVSPSERLLPNGKRNPHVTLKPIDLISWLIKLITPKDGLTIDITAGSCTHAVACEKLNYESGYSLRYIDVELCNSEENPYCAVGKQRVEAVIKEHSRKKKLF
jgi:site-specific DNA-methyltransferase (adenine-specific)